MYVFPTRTAAVPPAANPPLPAGNMLGFYFLNHLRNGLMGDLRYVLKFKDLAHVEVAHDPVTGNAAIITTKANGEHVTFCYDAFDRKFRVGLSPTAYNASVSFYSDALYQITCLETLAKKKPLSVDDARALSINRERLARAKAPLVFYDLFI